LAKKNKSTFAKREKELRRMRKAAEKMARRHAKRDAPSGDEVETPALGEESVVPEADTDIDRAAPTAETP
jgi:hypothetical protein